MMKTWIWSGTAKGGLISESNGRFSNCPKNGAQNYPELLHPVHSNDRILILNHILQVKNYHSFKI